MIEEVNPLWTKRDEARMRRRRKNVPKAPKDSNSEQLSCSAI